MIDFRTFLGLDPDTDGFTAADTPLAPCPHGLTPLGYTLLSMSGVMFVAFVILALFRHQQRADPLLGAQTFSTWIGRLICGAKKPDLDTLLLLDTPSRSRSPDKSAWAAVHRGNATSVSTGIGSQPMTAGLARSHPFAPPAVDSYRR